MAQGASDIRMAQEHCRRLELAVRTRSQSGGGLPGRMMEATPAVAGSHATVAHAHVARVTALEANRLPTVPVPHSDSGVLRIRRNAPDRSRLMARRPLRAGSAESLATDVVNVGLERRAGMCGSTMADHLVRRNRPATQVTQDVGTAYVEAAPPQVVAPDVSRKTPGSEGAGGLHCVCTPTGEQPKDVVPVVRMASEVENDLYVIQPPMRLSLFSSVPVYGPDPLVGTSWLRAAPEGVCEETPDLSVVDSEEIPRIVVERVATTPPHGLVGDPTHLGADLVARAPVKSATFLFSSVPEELRSAPCFLFRTEIRGQTAHALEDTGASENFVSDELARELGVMTHPLKHPVHILIADGSVLPCDQFARIKLRIGT